MSVNPTPGSKSVFKQLASAVSNKLSKKEPSRSSSGGEEGLSETTVVVQRKVGGETVPIRLQPTDNRSTSFGASIQTFEIRPEVQEADTPSSKPQKTAEKANQVSAVLQRNSDPGAKTHSVETPQPKGALAAGKSPSVPMSKGRPLPNVPATTSQWTPQGNVALQKGNLDSAVDLFTKGLEDAEEKKNTPLIIECLTGLGKAFLAKEQWVLASKILNGALALISKANDKENELLALLAELESRFLQKECRVQAKPVPETYRYRKKQLQTMRSTIGDRLKTHDSQKTDIIDFTRDILSLFSTSVAFFLEEILADGYKILGNPPCPFTLISLGSLGRRETSPYSDLEFAILIKESSPNHLAYFRKLVKWFEIQVINLGETEIKIFEHGLSSPVKRGFSFDDGGNTPLGKQSYVELIKTPQDMAQFQSERFYEEDLILSNVLRTAGLLTGDKNLYETYLKSMQEILSKKSNSSLSIAQNRALNIIKGHLIEFEPNMSSNKEEMPLFNIKAELYRLPSFLIAGLADYFGIEEQNNWDKLDALGKKNILCSTAVNNLKLALAKILRLRIRCHLHYGRECDEAYHPAMQRKQIPQERLKGAFIISDEMVNEIVEIYRILLPLHRLFTTASKKGDFKSLAKQDFYDNSLITQAEAYTKVSNYQMAKRLCKQAVAVNQDNSETQMTLINTLIALAEFDEAKKYLARLPQSPRPDLLMMQGLLSSSSGEHQKAKDCYQQALAILRKQEAEAHASIIVCLGNLGGIWLELGKAAEALTCCEEAQVIMTKNYGKKTPFSPLLLNQLGMVHKDLGNFKKSIETLEEALQIGRKMYGNEHSIVGTIYNNLGLAWKLSGDVQKAKEYFEKCLVVKRESLGSGHPDVAMAVNNLGSCYLALGDKQRAMQFYQEALESDKKTFGNQHPKVAVRLNNIGAALKDMGQAAEAIRYYEQALSIDRKALGERHPIVAVRLTNLGSAYAALKNGKKMIEYLEEALSIDREARGDMHPDVMNDFISLGIAWLELEEPEKALECFEPAVEISVNLNNGKMTLDTARIFTYAARAVKILGEEKAIVYFSKVIEIKKHYYGKTDLRLVSALYEMGQICQEFDNLQEAKECFEEAVKLEKTHLHPKDPQRSEGLNYLGIVLQKLGDAKKAFSYFEEALAIDLALGAEHSNVARDYNNMGLAMKQLRNYSQALQYHEKALNINRKNRGDNSPYVGLDLASLADIWEKMDDKQKALQYHKESLTVLKMNFPENHPWIQSELRSIAELNKRR
ncbi:MAG: tetratricopeptide repeat protein [Parachlamydia sp.]|nr:tetratricopeptide repeat protein [Parachlamydia sp.]